MSLSLASWAETEDGFTLTLPKDGEWYRTKALFQSHRPHEIIWRPCAQQLWETMYAAADAAHTHGTPELQGDLVMRVVPLEESRLHDPAIKRIRALEAHHFEEQEAVAYPLLAQKMSEVTHTLNNVLTANCATAREMGEHFERVKALAKDQIDAVSSCYKAALEQHRGSTDIDHTALLEIGNEDRAKVKALQHHAFKANESAVRDKEELKALSATVLNMGQVVSIDHTALFKTWSEKVNDLRADVYKGKSDVDKKLAEQSVEIARLRRVLDQRLVFVEQDRACQADQREGLLLLRREIDTLKELWGKGGGAARMLRSAIHK